MKAGLVAATFLTFTALAFPATIYVPDDYSAIQTAINVCVDGDTIIVRPGTYFENVDFVGKNVLLQSELGPAVTVIDGQQLSVTVWIASGEGPGAIVDGFTVTNGDPSNILSSGAGVCITNISTPIIRNNVITGNANANYGGGLYCGGFGSDATIVNNFVTSNDATNGGGIYVKGCSPLIQGNVVADNLATNGAGIECYDDGSATITDNIVRNNAATSSGGGIYLSVYSPALVSRNLVMGNTSGFGGAGIMCNASDATINGNQIRDNVAAGRGGGIYIRKGTVEVTNNVVSGNTAATTGAGLDIWDQCAVVMINNTVVGNTSSDTGGGMVMSYFADVQATNCIFWNNDAPNGDEICLSVYAPSLTINYCDLEGGQASVSVDASATLNWGANMIDSDPLFVEAGYADYHLGLFSPCKDAGDTPAGLPDEDFEGDPRNHDGAPEMGADEHHPHLYVAVHTPAGSGVTPGGTGAFKVIGPPGETVRVAGADVVRETPLSTRFGDFYLYGHLYLAATGTIGTDGVLTAPQIVPAYWTTGERHPFQALIGPLVNPTSTLTNYTVLVVE